MKKISHKNNIKSISNKRDKEYSKRLLNRIVNHSILMMWASYVLAWFGKTEIAETLSKTIATSIITVVVGYLAKSVVENISKYTDAFGKNINTELNLDQLKDRNGGNITTTEALKDIAPFQDEINTYRDC